MTLQQKFIAYTCGIVAALLFAWPAGPLVLFLIADLNGDIPTKASV